MNKIEQIELYLKSWKAGLDANKTHDDRVKAEGHIEGCEAAIRILKEPSNTRMHVDTNPCKYCVADIDDEFLDYCAKCRRALSQ